jgi:PAS domain S-box-containing protein
MTLHGAIVVRKGTTGIHDIAELKGRQVAVMKADNAEEFLRRKDRGVEIYTTPTFEDALRELSEGRHDAVFIQRLVALRLIQEMGITNLEVINKPVEGFAQDFCFAVTEGDKDTLALLNEGLAVVLADGTYRRLHAKWFAALELPSHRIVIGGDHNYPPFEFIDENGEPAGFNVDLVRAVAEEVGLDIDIQLGPWTQIREALERGEIDAVQGMLYSEERDRVYDFTQPYTVNHYVSVVRKGEGDPPAAPNELTGKRIAVQGGDIMDDFLKEEVLDVHVTAFDGQEDALRELAAGEYDCALAARMTALYWIDKKGWNNLVVGRDSLLSPGYCFAVPQGHKALLAVLSEGLNVLEETGEYRRIYEKWMGTYQDRPMDLGTILKYVALGTAPLLLVLAASILWTWSLRKQVATRTEELRRSEEQFRSLVEAAPDAIFVQTDYRFAYLNHAACRLFGADSADQLLGQPVVERFPPSVRAEVREHERELNVGKKAVYADQKYIRLDGTEIPV